jgi:hypothetical protein
MVLATLVDLRLDRQKTERRSGDSVKTKAALVAIHRDRPMALVQVSRRRLADRRKRVAEDLAVAREFWLLVPFLCKTGDMAFLNTYTYEAFGGPILTCAINLHIVDRE